MSETTALPHDILNLTAEITRGYLSRNEVQVAEVPDVIRTIYDTLSTVGNAEPVVEAPQEPAVDPRKSVFGDYIICLEDGKALKMLKRHLMTHYNMTPDQYRAKWKLPATYPMTAPNYAETRSGLAKKMGLGRARGRLMPVSNVEEEQEPVYEPEPVVQAEPARKRRGRPPGAGKAVRGRKAA